MEPIQALQIVFEFLASWLPAPLMTLAIGFAPVVAALVALALLIPWVKERKKWAAPVIALAISQAFGLMTMATAGATIYDVILMGIVTTFLAVGGVSWTKNVAQGAKGTKEPPAQTGATRRTGTYL